MIIFYHEMNSTSTGAAVLIMNLIRGLTERNEKVVLINFRQGAMEKELEKNCCEYLSVVDNSEKSIRDFAEKVTSSDIIISTHFYSVFRYFKKANPRFLFYCVGHVQLIEANRFGRLNFWNLTRKLIRNLKEKNGILFIEGNALNKSAKLLGLSPDGFTILPIPVPVPEFNVFSARRRKSAVNGINLTYVGRAVDTKIFPVSRLIKDLNGISLSTTVVLHIITDNAGEFAAKLPPITNTDLSIHYLENLLPDQLNSFLVENTDIHIAQATSALEGAKLGIPTILIDFSFRDFPEGYRYRFLYETPASYIGTDANEANEFDGLTMKELLDMARDTEVMRKVSERSFEYIRQNHDIRHLGGQLMDHLTRCSSNITDISPYLIRYWFRN